MFHHKKHDHKYPSMAVPYTSWSGDISFDYYASWRTNLECKVFMIVRTLSTCHQNNEICVYGESLKCVLLNLRKGESKVCFPNLQLCGCELLILLSTTSFCDILKTHLATCFHKTSQTHGYHRRETTPTTVLAWMRYASPSSQLQAYMWIRNGLWSRAMGQVLGVTI